MGRYFRIAFGLIVGVFYVCVTAIGIGVVANQTDGARISALVTIVAGSVFAYAAFHWAAGARHSKPKTHPR